MRADYYIEHHEYGYTYPLNGFPYFSSKGLAKIKQLSSVIRWTRRAIIGPQYKVIRSNCFCGRMMCENEGRTMQVAPQTHWGVSSFWKCIVNLKESEKCVLYRLTEFIWSLIHEILRMTRRTATGSPTPSHYKLDASVKRRKPCTL